MLFQPEFLLFYIGQRIFALPIQAVLRILPMVTIMPVLQTDDRIRGVINVHGELVPVINAHICLGLPEPALKLHTPLLLVQGEQRQVGVIVDQVIDVLSIPSKEITVTEQLLPGGLCGNTVVVGLAVTAFGTASILDVGRLFSPSEPFIVAEPNQAAPAIPETDGETGPAAVAAEWIRESGL